MEKLINAGKMHRDNVSSINLILFNKNGLRVKFNVALQRKTEQFGTINFHQEYEYGNFKNKGYTINLNPKSRLVIETTATDMDITDNLKGFASFRNVDLKLWVKRNLKIIQVIEKYMLGEIDILTPEGALDKKYGTLETKHPLSKAVHIITELVILDVGLGIRIKVNEHYGDCSLDDYLDIMYTLMTLDFSTMTMGAIGYLPEPNLGDNLVKLGKDNSRINDVPIPHTDRDVPTYGKSTDSDIEKSLKVGNPPKKKPRISW